MYKRLNAIKYNNDHQLFLFLKLKEFYYLTQCRESLYNIYYFSH